jgi:hypothetical protein
MDDGTYLEVAVAVTAVVMVEVTVATMVLPVVAVATRVDVTVAGLTWRNAEQKMDARPSSTPLK